MRPYGIGRSALRRPAKMLDDHNNGQVKRQAHNSANGKSRYGVKIRGLKKRARQLDREEIENFGEQASLKSEP